MNIKSLCVMSFLTFMSGMAFAQDTECFVIDALYSIDVSESAKLTGNAVVVSQDGAFHMSGDGIDVYCDGTSVWTMDYKAKEVYIESLDAESGNYLKEAAGRLSGMADGSEAEFVTPDGHNGKVMVKSIKKSDRKDISSFRPMNEFDSSWVVVDLR